MAASGTVDATCLVCQEKAEVRAETFLGGQASITCKLCGTALVVRPDGKAELAVHAAVRPKSVPPPAIAPGAPIPPPAGASTAAATVTPAPPGAAPVVSPAVTASAGPASAAPVTAQPSITETARAARAFDGLLEKVAVPDVVQLICQSRKTGILTLTGQADGKFGAGKLVFSEGQIVGCEHPSRAFQVGRVLVHMGAVTDEQIERAASAQRVAGKERKALVATLVEAGIIDEQTGWKAIEKLVQSTMVEAMLWETGTFSFNASKISPADSFRHVPEGMAEALGVDAQNALTEAVRILDATSHTDDAPADGGDVEFELDPAADGLPAADAAAAKRRTTGGLKRRLRSLAAALPRPPQLLLDPRAKWVGLAAGGGIVLLVIILIFALGGDDSVPIEVTSVEDSTATTADDAPGETEPAMPGEAGAPQESPTKRAVKPDRNRAKRAATGSSRDGKRKAKGKPRGKRKKKPNDAGSFFDAALQSDP